MKWVIAILCVYLAAFSLNRVNASRSDIQHLEGENQALVETLKDIGDKKDNDVYVKYLDLTRDHFRLYSDWLRLKDTYEGGANYGS